MDAATEEMIVDGVGSSFSFCSAAVVEMATTASAALAATAAAAPSSGSYLSCAAAVTASDNRADPDR